MFNRDNLEKQMNLRGWTKYRLAKEAGIGQSTLHEILSGKKTSPNANTLSKLASALEVSVDEFFMNEDKMVIKVQKDRSPLPADMESMENGLFPSHFITPSMARSFVESFTIFGSDGFESNKLDDKEIIEFANALLEQMDMMKYKYKK